MFEVICLCCQICPAAGSWSHVRVVWCRKCNRVARLRQYVAQFVELGRLLWAVYLSLPVGKEGSNESVCAYVFLFCSWTAGSGGAACSNWQHMTSQGKRQQLMTTIHHPFEAAGTKLCWRCITPATMHHTPSALSKQPAPEGKAHCQAESKKPGSACAEKQSFPPEPGQSLAFVLAAPRCLHSGSSVWQTCLCIRSLMP